MFIYVFVCNLFIIGVKNYILSKVSDFYTREVNDALNNLVELIQPILIAGIGVLIGLLFASILIPIYNLAQAF